jgi:hypothetical protein
MQGCDEYRNYLKLVGVNPEIVRVFRHPEVMGEERNVLIDGKCERHVYGPMWWSPAMRELMRHIDERVQLRATINTLGARGAKRSPRHFPDNKTAASTRFPRDMPRDLVSEQFLSLLPAGDVKDFRIRLPVLPANIPSIFPATEAAMYTEYSDDEQAAKEDDRSFIDDEDDGDKGEELVEDVEEEDEGNTSDVIMDLAEIKQESDMYDSDL